MLFGGWAIMANTIRLCFRPEMPESRLMSDSKPGSEQESKSAVAEAAGDFDYFVRHMKFGWWSLFLFMALGFFLEYLHGFKVGWYLNVGNEMRRLMFQLAHAHGTLFSVLHILFALTARAMPASADSWLRLASPLLMATSILMPGGFFLGGVWIYDGDPGLGIFLVPIGALTMFVSVFVTARGVSRDGGRR